MLNKHTKILSVIMLVAMVLSLFSGAVAEGDAQEDEISAVAEEIVPEDTVPEEIAPGDAVVEEVAPEDAVAEEIAPEDAVVEEVAPQDAVAEEIAPEDAVGKEIAPEKNLRGAKGWYHRNDTEFHIVGIDTMKKIVADSSNYTGNNIEGDIKIYTVDVHGTREKNGKPGTADGGKECKYSYTGDKGRTGSNGKLVFYDNVWKVLNTFDVLKDSSVTGITIYAKVNGNETSVFTSELYLNHLEGLDSRITQIVLSPPTYTITVTSGENGTVSPANATVAYGENAEFTVTPNEGYEIDEVIVDEDTDVKDQLIDGKYTFTDVRANHAIYATFKEKAVPVPTYTITATSGKNGTISPKNAEVEEGGETEFAVTPNEGYEIDEVIVDEDTDVKDQLIDGKYTFTDVSTNHTIHATFKEKAVPVPEKVTVTFENNNGKYKVVGDSTVDLDVEGTLTAEQIPSVSLNKNRHRWLYKFEGWKNGENTLTTDTVISEDVTYTAAYSPIVKFQFNYRPKGFKKPTGFDVTFKRKIHIGSINMGVDTKVPDMSEYDGRWCHKNGKKKVYFNSNDELLEHLESHSSSPITYMWVKEEVTEPPVTEEFTVTFLDYNEDIIDTQQVEKGEDATPPEDPTRGGYTFAGWDGNYTNIQQEETVIATYTKNPVDPPIIIDPVVTYSVIYDANEATAGSVPTDSSSYFIGSSVTVKGNEGGLLRDKAIFLGFSAVKNGLITTEEAEESAGIIASFDISSDITLYAVWAQDENENNVPDYKEVSIPDDPTPEDPQPKKPVDPKPTDPQNPDSGDTNPTNPDDVTIEDGDTPLGDLPTTGDNSKAVVLFIIMVLSMCGVTWLQLGRKHRENQN